MEKLMWYRTPTQDYMEGLPLGNGRLAAMALGTPERFRLALNHEWLWRGENRLRDFDDVHEHLSNVRELLLAGRFAEGTRLANDYFGGGGSMKGGPNRVDPVSYTHLDVYKRQVRHHPNRVCNVYDSTYPRRFKGPARLFLDMRGYLPGKRRKKPSARR